MPRIKKQITYHGRTGRPMIHTAASGKRYIVVRAKGGGVKRLYEGSLYYEELSRSKGKKTWRRLKL